MIAFRVLDPTVPASIPRQHCALAVMTKAPQPGQVKTRLIPPLTSHEAAELNKCFLRDTAIAISAAAMSHPVCGVAVFTPLGAESAYADILPPDFVLLPQRGEHFGERLYFAAADLFNCGFASVCLINSDSPTVPAESFLKAVELLNVDKDRVVLGPCDDGGYYLIGLKQPHPGLFERIDWSTERVLDQTMHRAAKIGVEIKLLPIGHDVDDHAALRRLCEELLDRPPDDLIAPNTRKFLASVVARKEL
jgi:rSAM/selenodomain-associated transferase 1